MANHDIVHDSTIHSGVMAAASQPASPLPLWLRCILSVLVMGHVMAIFIPPFTFSTSGMVPTEGSPVAVGLMSVFRPYCDLTFLNHGYAFFAPDPGPSHLVRAHLEFDDGRPGKDITFPNLKEEWPRLLYHRHFMLSETLNTRFVPPTPPPDVAQDSSAYQSWQHARKVYESITQSFEKHLAKTHGAASAVLTRVEHRQPIPDEFERQKDKVQIDDPRLYRDLPETAMTAPIGSRPANTGAPSPTMGGRRPMPGARP